MARLLAQGGLPDSPLVTIARVRQALRDGAPDAALTLALPLAEQAPGSPLAGQVWPYVSTCWRLLDDPRSAWLDGDGAFVRAVDVGLSAAELADLAAVLRGLHQAQLPYPEQSVRGGTQTDRSVLLRHEAPLVRAREAARRRARLCRRPAPARSQAPAAVAPAAWAEDQRQLVGAPAWRGFQCHPLPSTGLDQQRLYVALPDPAESAASDAGHFHYGAPPAELGLDLAPYGTIAPAVGQLVLFPPRCGMAPCPSMPGTVEHRLRHSARHLILPC
jgi:hypothetical protein